MRRIAGNNFLPFWRLPLHSVDPSIAVQKLFKFDVIPLVDFDINFFAIEILLRSLCP